MLVKNVSIIKLYTVSLFLFLISYFCYSKDSKIIKKLSETGNHSVFISIIENNPLFLPLFQYFEQFC